MDRPRSAQNISNVCPSLNAMSSVIFLVAFSKLKMHKRVSSCSSPAVGVEARSRQGKCKRMFFGGDPFDQFPNGGPGGNRPGGGSSFNGSSNADTTKLYETLGVRVGLMGHVLEIN